MVSRRHLLAAVGVGALCPLIPGLARAGVARALRLEELVQRSPHIFRGTPLESYSEWARFDDEKRIVTYTRVQVDEAVAGAAESELLVRTLGGTVGKIGQLVPDEAELVVGQPCMAFFMPVEDGVLAVTGMAQGHYPLRIEGGALRLKSAMHLAPLLTDKVSAVARLNGRSLIEARDLVRQVSRP